MLNRLGNLLPAFGWLGGADRTEPGSGTAVRSVAVRSKTPPCSVSTPRWYG